MLAVRLPQGQPDWCVSSMGSDLMTPNDEMALWDFGFEAASARSVDHPDTAVDIDGIVLNAIDRGVLVPTDCCSVCPHAKVVADAAKAFLEM